MDANSYNKDLETSSDAEIDTSSSDSDDLADDLASGSWAQGDRPVGRIRFGEFLEAILIRIQQARHAQFASHPPRSKAEHNDYWRTFFTQARQDAMAGLMPMPTRAVFATRKRKTSSTEERPAEDLHLVQSGPLFEPPCNKVGIVFAEKEDVTYSYCPCCLMHQGDADYYVVARDEILSSTHAQPESSSQAASRQGATFDMLLKSISDSLYGRNDGTPAVYAAQDEYLPVIHVLDCMTSDGVLTDGNLYIYCDDYATGEASIDAEYNEKVNPKQ